MGKKKMDVIDLKILEELKENSRVSFNDISKSVGKTEATIRRRVKKLIEEGIIKRFTIDYTINSKPKTRATVKIEPDFKEIKTILKDLRGIEEITDIWRLSGECGLFIKVEIDSIENFNPLIENKISQIKGVKISETCFITDIIK
ncbi:MAG: Lrp/AsnC family transcriptional regulator [Promethearchaeota archaeon]